MILGIDATNIRAGGGLTHLKEILYNRSHKDFPFEKIIIWGSNTTLNNLPDDEIIFKKSHFLLNKSFVFSFLFQIFMISNLAKKENCKLLFVPGGTFLGTFKSFVSMSQNMLPFQKEESNRFKDFKSRLRFKLLYFTQSYTFRRSKGVIFLSKFAKDFIINRLNLKTNFDTIPHGINLSFLNLPKPQREMSNYNFENPYKLLYVSIVTVYKHQWNVAAAVFKLREEGYPVVLNLIGANTYDSLEKVNNIIKKDIYSCIKYSGLKSYEDLEQIYKSADAFVFASSCENLPIILVEAMTAGLPIASSSMGPMPEVLGKAGFYFDPLNPTDIYNSLKIMFDNSELRSKKAVLSYNKSLHYTWKDCSARTFEYLHSIAKNLSNENTK